MSFPINPNPGDSYQDSYNTTWVYAGPVNGWYRQTVSAGNQVNYSADFGGDFIQTGTGAVQRTVQSKLQDVVSVKDFGAVGDGVADDTAAIQAAVNAASTGSAVVFLPNGVYRCTSAISVTNARVFSLLGCGIGASILRFTSPGGLTITFSTPSSTDQSLEVATIQDLSLEASCAEAGVAINASWATAVGDSSVGLIVKNCYIGSRNKEQVENDYWTTGLKVTNGRRIYISNCVF